MKPPREGVPPALDELAEGAPEDLQRDVAEAIRAERRVFDDPAQDGAHESFRREEATREDVERVWATFWLPSLRGEDGKVSLEKLKGELFDCYHLIMAAPKVYLHVTGGITDDPTASPEGIIQLAERQVANRMARARDGLADADRSGLLHRIREQRREAVIEAARAVLADVDGRTDWSTEQPDVSALRDALKALEATK